MEEKPNQRVMLTRQLLKNSLVEMLRTERIYKISVRELCERAGINRSTFYKHYGSQMDVLLDLEEDMTEQVTHALEQFPNDYQKTIEALCRYLEQNLAIARLLFNSGVDPEFPERLFALPAVRNALVCELQSKDRQLDTDYLITFYIYGCFYSIRSWLNRENREPPEQFAAILAKTISQAKAPNREDKETE